MQTETLAFAFLLWWLELWFHGLVNLSGLALFCDIMLSGCKIVLTGETPSAAEFFCINLFLLEVMICKFLSEIMFRVSE